MACTIVIQNAVGEGQPGTPLLSLTVTGTATGCATVSVSIVCSGGSQAVTHPSVPVMGGMWQTVFSAQEVKVANCRECGNPNYALTVRAVCTQPGQECGDSKIFSEIPCQYGCPTIDHIEVDLPTCAEVTAANGWTVTFNGYIDGTGVTFCLWNFGDGSQSSSPLPQGGVTTIQHTFECAGTYPVTLTIFSDCQPRYYDDEVVDVELPPCGCPTISSFEAKVDANNNCRWNFSAKVGAPFTTCVTGFLWNFGDGHQDTSGVPAVQHDYDHDGTYTVTLTLLGVEPEGGGACYQTIDVDVAGCKDGNGGGGDGDDHKPCSPWWHPKCWGSLCGALVAAALASILTAVILFVVAGCVVLSPAVLAGPWGAVVNALVGSALFISAVASLIAGMAFLLAWYLVCSHLPGYDFCDTLADVILALSYFIAIQAAVAIALAFLSPIGCLIGWLVSLGGMGVVLGYLEILKHQAGCN